ncbi:MAG: transcriptional regulator GutM [Anaerovoracaceae bacterium]|jgi:DNA-binding transcriptional regulator of glucitol operon
MFETIGTIIIGIGIYFIYYSFLVLIQSVRMNNAIVELEQIGRAYMGRDGNFFTTRNLILVATDKNNIIRKGKKVRATFIFKPCKVFEYDNLNGLNVLTMNTRSLDPDPRMTNAINNLKETAVKQNKRRR